ncbi:MAG: ABC transporter ATP-binding protein [Lachnospiraceae bacterium]|nr:ABC transporter ATP-binding protein [Lachnospiraceae bacterium]
MLTLENVTKIYKGDLFETRALQDVSLTVEQGEFVAIMGESGSGKTTLLNIIGGMDTLSSGKYYLQDVAVHECNPAKLDKVRKQYISFIFQHFALMEEYNVFENIEAPLLARNVRKSVRKKKIQELAEKLGIDELLDKYPSQISGGQKQRVAFARALVTNSPVILADEPTGALDEENTQKVMELFKELHNDGKTIVLITHDNMVANYADRIVNLRDGKVIL